MANKIKRKITAKDLYDLNVITSMDLSKDGKKIVYSLLRIDKKTEKKYSSLFLIDTESGKERRLTFGDWSDGNPQFSPDGKSIAFMSNRKDKTQSQIYILNLKEGGDAHAISNMNGGFSGFSWSPNGRQILFSFRKKDKEVLEREKDKSKKELGIVKRHITRVFYKTDGAHYNPKERTHLYLLTVKNGAVKQLTKGDKNEEMPSWSPDGKSIVYKSNVCEEPEMDYSKIDLFVLDVKTRKSKKIETPEGYINFPTFSPDGQSIAYLAQRGVRNWYENNNLWIVKADGSENPQNLSEHLDLNFKNATLGDTGGMPGYTHPVWSPDASKIYLQYQEHGCTHIGCFDLETKNLSPYFESKSAVNMFAMDTDCEQCFILQSTLEEPAQIKRIEKGKTVALTNINPQIPSKINLGKIEEVWFKGLGGNDLQGWILKPPGFRSNKKYPSILEIHGGPLCQYGNAFMHEFYYLAAQGYVVYFCNPRGGDGYGEEHAKAIWGEWGGKDYEDLMCWVDYVAKQKYIDKKRMGVTGGSYGGYMTNWIIGHTNRFKAAVTQRCVSNLISMWATSDFNYVFEAPFSGKMPIDDIDHYWDRSPLKYFGNVKTPTLVIHSERDHRCALEQGEQVFVTLKRLGVPTEFLIFPDEPHGLSRGGRTDRRIARLEAIKDWFDKYL